MSRRDRSLTALLERQQTEMSDVKEDTAAIKKDTSEIIDAVKPQPEGVGRHNTFTSDAIINQTNELHALVDNSFENTEFGKILSSIDKGINDKNSNLGKLILALQGKLSTATFNNTSTEKTNTNEKVIEKTDSTRFFKGIREFNHYLGLKDFGMIGKPINDAIAYRKRAKEQAGNLKFKFNDDFSVKGTTKKVGVNLLEGAGRYFSPLGKMMTDKRAHKEYVDDVLEKHPRMLSAGRSEKEVREKLLIESKELRSKAKEYVELEKDLDTLMKSEGKIDQKMVKTIESKMEKIQKFINKTDRTNKLDVKPVKSESVNEETNKVDSLVNNKTDNKVDSLVANKTDNTSKNIETLSTQNLTEIVSKLNTSDSNTVSQEEADQSKFQARLLDSNAKQYNVTEKQLQIQSKIYEILKRFDEKGFSSASNEKKDDTSILDGIFTEDRSGKKKPTRTSTRTAPRAPGRFKRALSTVGKAVGGAATGAVSIGKSVLKSGIETAGAIASTASEVLPNKAIQIAETAKSSVGKVAGAAKAGAARVISKEALKDTGKLISESIAKRLPKAALKAAGKSIPGIGALIGLGSAAVSLASGDTVAAGLEAVSGLGSMATAIPATAALVAKEVYEDVYGVKPEEDPEVGSRMTEIKDKVWEEMKKLTGNADEVKPEETPKEDAGKLLEDIKPEENKGQPSTESNVIKANQKETKLEPSIPEGMTQSTMVAGELVTKGMPLSSKQISAVETAIKLGNKPSPLVKESYDLAKASPLENGAIVNGQETKAEPVKDYKTEFSKIEEERVKAARQFSESSNTEEDIKIFKEQLSKVEDMKVNLLAEKDNKPKDEIRKMLEASVDPTTPSFYDLKPNAPTASKSNELIKASVDSETAKMNMNRADSGSSNTIISPTTINNNQTTVVRKDVKNNDGSLNRLFDSRRNFNS